MNDEEHQVKDLPPGQIGHPAAQIPLSSSLVDRLGDSVRDYARELWEAAQHRDLDADQMTALLEDVNRKYDVTYPPTVLDKMQEILRNSGGFVTVINEESVLAGAVSDDGAHESPHAANASHESTDTAG